MFYLRKSVGFQFQPRGGVLLRIHNVRQFSVFTQLPYLLPNKRFPRHTMVFGWYSAINGFRQIHNSFCHSAKIPFINFFNKSFRMKKNILLPVNILVGHKFKSLTWDHGILNDKFLCALTWSLFIYLFQKKIKRLQIGSNIKISVLLLITRTLINAFH